MRQLIFLAIFFLLVNTSFAQGALILPDSSIFQVPDSSTLNTDPPAILPNSPASVYDIYWVTNSIKSGWKSTDTALVGAGLELCDTAHPFIMPVNGKFWRGCTSYHSGWDIGSDYGTPIKAAMVGKVRYAGYCSGYGKLVITRHYTGMEMYYSHLSKILVTPGQFVDAGDTVGLVGATGRARGNHLHMEFRLCDRALDIADYYVQNDTVVNLYKIFDSNKKQSNPQTAEYHMIVRGDNLWDISRKYGTTVNNLCALNHISKNTTLRIGQKLKVR